MSNEHELSTDDVHNAFNQTNVWLPGIGFNEYAAAFDRWLAAHDAEVAAKALEDAAKWYRSREPKGGWNRSTAEPSDYEYEMWSEWQASATELDGLAAALRENEGNDAL